MAGFKTHAELGARLAPLLDGQEQRYAELARDSAKHFEAFASAVEAGEDPMAIVARSRKSCTACHTMRVAGGERLQVAAKRERIERGVGDGAFVLGFDAFSGGAEREKAQAMASALRRLTLLMDQHGAVTRG